MTRYNCTASGLKASIGVVASLLLGFLKADTTTVTKECFCAASCWYDGWHSPN